MGIFGAISKGMKVGHRQHIRYTERLRDVTLSLNGPHPQSIPSNAVGSFGQGYIGPKMFVFHAVCYQAPYPGCFRSLDNGSFCSCHLLSDPVIKGTILDVLRPM